MSTTINVTVDDGGLPARNRQQTAANRQAYVQKTAAEQAAKQGEAQLRLDRIAAGLDPDTGLPVVTIGGADTLRTKRVDQEPAANRQGYGAVLTAPLTYVDYGGSYSGLTVRCRGNRNVPASRSSFEESKAYPEGVVVPGPLLGTFALEPAPAPNQPAPTTISGQRQDNAEFLTFTNYTEPSAELPAALNAYVVQGGPYDAVLDWQRGAYVDEIPQPPYNVINLTGQETPVSGFRSLSRIRTFTHEFIIRMPLSAFDDIGSTAYTTESSTVPLRSAAVTAQFGGLSVTVGVRDLWYISDGFLLDTFEPAPSGGTIIISVNELTRTSAFSVTASIFAPTFTDSDGEFLQGSPPIGVYNLSAVEPGDFLHCAISRYSTETGPRWAFYVDGQTLISGIREPENWTATYGTQPPSVRLFLTALRNRIAPTVLPVPALHASRFTPRALYSGTFTPPASITSFALP